MKILDCFLNGVNRDAHKFLDDYLGLSETKIHYLKNKREYDSVAFDELNELVIKKGKAINNWILLLIISIALLCGGIYTTKNIIEFFNAPTGGRIFIEEILMALFLIVLGASFFYESVRKEKILIFEKGGKQKRFSLTKFDKKGELDDFIGYLSSKVNLRNEMN